MSAFNGFNQQTPAPALNPRLALVAAIIYIGSADGRIDDDEINEILKFAKTKQTLHAALEYTRRCSYEQFLQAAGSTLSPQQKLCAILNCADMAMGDGFLAPAEQQRLQLMAQWFQIPDAHLQPYVQTLMLKNNTGVFQ